MPLLIIALFLPGSIRQVGQHKMAMTLQRSNGRVSLDRLYFPGRHYIGFWKSFLEFPMTLETIDFSNDDVGSELDAKDMDPLNCRDRDGKLLIIDVTAQYMLPTDIKKMAQLYREFKLNYEGFIVAELRAELVLAGNLFRADDFWKNREALNKIFFDRCKIAMARRHVVCWGLQVWGVRLQKGYEDKVIKTQVVTQRRKTQIVMLDAARVRAATNILLATLRKNVTVTTAYGEAQVYSITKLAIATAEARLVSVMGNNIDLVSATFRRVKQLGVMSRMQSVVYQWRMLLEVLCNRGGSNLTNTRSGSAVIVYNDVPNVLGPVTPAPSLPDSFSAHSYAGAPMGKLTLHRRLADTERGAEEHPQSREAPASLPSATAANGALLARSRQQSSDGVAHEL